MASSRVKLEVKFDGDRFRISGDVVFNPHLTDTIEYIQERMALLQNLVAAYIEIDRLTPMSTETCSSAAKAFVYLLNFDYDTYPGSGRRPNHQTAHLMHGVNNWTAYMDYVQRQVALCPNFALWDKHTKEIESFALKALSESEKVLEFHNSPNKLLPKELVDGIYARIKVLGRWREVYLDPIRARNDYKEWKEKQTTPVTQKSQLRRRVNHTLLSTTASELPNVSNALGHSSSRLSALQTLHTKFNDDLTIWILSLSIYLSCAIIQAISFSQLPDHPGLPSTSATFNALQSTLTQMLSAIMTYILTIRSLNSHTNHLRKRHKAWFVLAFFLPIVSLAAMWWTPGVSDLLSFVGTAVTGFLQVVLVVDMKGPKVLP